MPDSRKVQPKSRKLPSMETSGLYRIPAGTVPISNLREKQRKQMVKLIMAGYSKGFVDLDEEGERVIWELRLFKNE